MVKLSNDDHNKLDALLGQILDWHASGDITKLQAIGVVAHVIAATAQGNESEVHSWLHDPAVLKRWKAAR